MEKPVGSTTVDKLNDLHQDLVGDTINLTDMDKIVGVLETLAAKVEDLEGHSHAIGYPK